MDWHADWRAVLTPISTHHFKRMLANVLQATFRLLTFRAGPQDFPYDPQISGWLIPLTVLINYLVLSFAMPGIVAAATALSVVVGTAFATRIVLRIRQLESRFTQTYHALLAASCMLTLFLAIPFSEIAPEIARIAEMDPETLDPNEQLQIPGWAALLMNGLNIWNYVVNANIFRHAANLPLAGGLLVALLVAIGVLVFVVFVASFIAAMFGAAS